MTRTVALKPGDEVDRFRICKLLGVGGMGEVYLAQDTGDLRSVALKTLSEDHVQFDILLDLFKAEVELCRKVAHPNVVNFIAQGQSNGLRWVALEYLTGTSLRCWLQDHGPAELNQGLSWLQDLAFALHAAHQQRILHRDIKPDNVMITDDGTIKLIDFGLARQGSGEGERQSARVGTLAYMAPECFQGRGVDERSDIYSLGLIAFELLTGRRLVEDVGLASAILEAHEEADELGSFLPLPSTPRTRAVETLVQSMLRRAPDARLASTRSLVAELTELVGSESPFAPSAEARSAKRMAQAELADTHYWQAKSLQSEGRVVEAIREFLEISTFADELGESARRNLIGELDLLYFALDVRRSPEDDDPHHLPRESYLELLVEMTTLYGRIASEEALRLKLRLVLRRVNALLDEGRRQVVVDELLALHPESIPVTRAFLDGMTQRFPAVARDVSLKFTRNLLRLGHLIEAEGELDLHGERFGKDADWKLAMKELVLAQAEFQDEEAFVLEQFAESRPVKSSAYCEDLCLRFLARHAPSAHVLQALASVRRKERRHGDLGQTLLALGALRFRQGRLDAARRVFVEALELDGRNLVALNFLAEILDEQGRLEGPIRELRDLCRQIYERFGLYGLHRDELARGLTGTPGDEDLLRTLEALARKEDHGEDLWRWRFERGRRLLEGGVLEESRQLFDEALAAAPDLARALDELQSLPGLRRLYGPAELLRLRTRSATHDDGDGWLAALRAKGLDG